MSDHKSALIVILALLMAVALGQPSPTDDSKLVGTWKGKMYGVPAVTLVLKKDGGKINGTVLFFLIRHNDGKPPRSSPGIVEPLIDPQFDGKVLRFQVSHRNAHPPRTLNDPPVNFRFTLINDRKAFLVREGGEPDSSGELVKER
jgi:hypothetical protein